MTAPVNATLCSTAATLWAPTTTSAPPTMAAAAKTAATPPSGAHADLAVLQATDGQ
ncbi:hypothetical protein [Streptomyces sp. NPDC047009]|uniref:hypothetical protein n=1 Tax=unclassified Streptomyces TaxID=2593676 RepID=UPI0033FA7633